MSPFEINIILHIYASAEPVGERYAGCLTAETLKRFVSLDLIDRGDFPKITSKGVAYVEMLMSTPFPVEKFVDPRTNEIIMKEST